MRTSPTTEAPGESRGVTITVLIAGAIFFATLGHGVVRAPMAMHPALAWLLRAFIGLLFGALSLAALLEAWRQWRGPGRALPAALRGRCLCCGEGCTEDATCGVCAMPPHDRAAMLSPVGARWTDSALFAAGALAALCLGLFLSVGPWMDGERRGWVLLATCALALLMLVVGGAGFVWALDETKRRWRAASRVHVVWREGPRAVTGQGALRRGVLVTYAGEGTRWGLLDATAAREGGYRASRDLRLAEMLVTFEAAGLLALHAETAWRWSLDVAGAGFARSVGQCVVAEPVVSEVLPGSALVDAASRHVARVLPEALPVARLAEALAEAPDDAAQWAELAAALRAAGVPAPSVRVEVVHAALAGDRQGD